MAPELGAPPPAVSSPASLGKARPVGRVIQVGPSAAAPATQCKAAPAPHTLSTRLAPPRAQMSFGVPPRPTCKRQLSPRSGNGEVDLVPAHDQVPVRVGGSILPSCNPKNFSIEGKPMTAIMEPKWSGDGLLMLVVTDLATFVDLFVSVCRSLFFFLFRFPVLPMGTWARYY